MAPRYWPLNRGHIITSEYGPRWGTMHRGVDFGWPGGSAGQPVFAVQAGTVVAVASDPQGFGRYVDIDSDDSQGSNLWVYGHIVPEVQRGERVAAGQRIGHVNGDRATNGGVDPHVHVEVHDRVRRPAGPGRMDPLPFFAGALFPGESAAPVVPAPTVAGLTAETLSAAMGGTLSIERYRALLPAFTDALIQSGCTTVERAAMFCAQIGHESDGLRYMEELGGDAYFAKYNGRSDLGNTQPGDGPRFHGRGPIQVTGRHNYTQLSGWAHSKGLVPSPTFFVDQPAQLASDRYGFLGAIWYWTVARPGINAQCDDRNLDGVTRAINGGLNGIDDRRQRYDRCLRLGAALLPDDGGFLSALSPDEQRKLFDRTNQLWEFLIDPKPSLVDPSQHYSAASLAFTADFHAARGHAYAKEARDLAQAIKATVDSISPKKDAA